MIKKVFLIGVILICASFSWAKELSPSIQKARQHRAELVQKQDEMLELLDNTKVLLVFNDDIADELEYDFTKISKIISFAPCSNKTTEISDIVIPTKTWLEKEGSFVNAMGETQTFTAAVESDALSEIEIIEKLNG